MPASRLTLSPTVAAFRCIGGPTYAYRVGDKAARDRARRRAARWLRRNPGQARGDAVPKVDRRLSAPGGPERTYRARIKRNVCDPIAVAIRAYVGPVVREMAAEQAAEKRARGDQGGWAARLLAALGVARIRTRTEPVPVDDVGAATAKHATDGAAAYARAHGPAGSVARIDIGRTEAQRAALTTWAREQAEYVSSITPNAYDRLAKVIAENVREGTQARTVAKMLERQFQIDANRAQLIARTEIAKLNSTVGQDAMRRSGSDGYIWRTADDERVRELHADLEGQFIRWDDPPVIGENGETGHPGGIYNCFPGSTLVRFSPQVLGAYRRWYSGEATTIVTDAGEPVRCTPNHPILTGRGWLPAHLVQVGDDLLTTEADGLDVAPMEDPEHGHATIEQVFGALACAFGQHRSASVGVGFHGDATPDEEVHVVRADWNLPLEISADREQEIVDRLLVLADATASSECHALQLIIGAHRPADRIVRGLSQALALRWACAGHAGNHPLGPVAGPDPAALQVIRDGAARDPEIGSDLLHAVASLESLDDVSDVDLLRVGCRAVRRDVDEPIHAESLGEAIRADVEGSRCFGEGRASMKKRLRVLECSSGPFSGHVFNLETVSGWYTTLPTVRNCRCIAEPVYPDPDA